MFRALRRRKKLFKWILASALGVVSVGMVLMLAPLPNLNNTLTSAQSSTLAKVGSETITANQLQRMIESQMRNSQYGYDPSLIPALATPMLDQMVMQSALIYEAKKMGLEVTREEIYQALQSFAWLYPGGKYVGADRAGALIQEETGESPQQFEADLSNQLLVNKLRAAVSDGVAVTPAEIQESFIRRNTKAKIEYVSFDPSKLLSAVKITPAALAAYFAKNQAQYKVPEERQVRYVLIDADHVQPMVNVTDQQVKQYYTDHIDDYQVPDRVKVADILFKTMGKTPAEIAAVTKLAQNVLAQIHAGAQFSAMAQKYSEDPSASNGGMIGWIIHGQAVRQFEDTAFAMKPGQVSGLVTTSYGIYIIKVFDNQKAHLETYDEVKDAIRTSLVRQQTADTEQKLANQLQAQMSVHPEQFEAIAKKAGLTAKESPLFKMNQAVPDFGTSQTFQNLAFQLELNQVGQPIDVPKGEAVVQVVKIVAAHVPQLAEVQPDVEEDYRAAQSKVLAVEKAQAFAAAAAKGNFDQLAKAQGLKVEQSKDFTRYDFVNNVGPGSSLAAAFTLPVGATSGPISGQNGQVVFRVVSHTPANMADLPAQRSQLAENLLQTKRELAFEIFQHNLKQQLLRSGKLQLNRAALAQFLAAYSKS